MFDSGIMRVKEKRSSPHQWMAISFAASKYLGPFQKGAEQYNTQMGSVSFNRVTPGRRYWKLETPPANSSMMPFSTCFKLASYKILTMYRSTRKYEAKSLAG
mmetsp:Transcript_6699/g.16797  ORF Transcript_6699/g.16797 Transcript_6699/m.16797 type:complete len:102 (+) Transcript_6699:1068-1373(+)